ncbi:MAG: hypothetical protein AAFQ43_05855 [Bacteroidota bacterium]
MSSLLRLVAGATLLFIAVPASGQPVFASGSTTNGAISGDDDCGLDPGAACSRHSSRISARTGRADEMFSSLQFGFSGGDPCSVQAPRPVGGMQIIPSSRKWNECPNGRANRTETLSTTNLAGPDYGLNRLRICTASDGTLQGVEARFFKLPHVRRTGPGQEVVTRSFERNRCETWQAWSTCPTGQSAAGLDIYSQTENNGDVQGIRLVCRRVLASAGR